MRSKYYSPIEVAAHSTLKDLWVSYLGKVYDLTPLAETHQGELTSSYFSFLEHQLLCDIWDDILGDVLLKPIVLAAGTDISHWFNRKTREVCFHYCFTFSNKVKCILMLLKCRAKHNEEDRYRLCFAQKVFQHPKIGGRWPQSQSTRRLLVFNGKEIRNNDSKWQPFSKLSENGLIWHSVLVALQYYTQLGFEN